MRAYRENSDLVIVVSDDGGGGAHLNGTGLRGIADRVEAAGGVLSVRSDAVDGTETRAVLPCPIAA